MSEHHEAQLPSSAQNALSTSFSNIMMPLTHQWGFVAVRTAFAADEATDNTQWSAALAKLRSYALPAESDADVEMDPDTFALPVMADRVLDGADYKSIRTAFKAWVENYPEPWESNIRSDCALVIDGPSLKSLLDAPERAQRKKDSDPWVVVVDVRDPASVPYIGGGPYQGWMRASTLALGSLFEDLDSRVMSQICPVRVYDGQIPLFDGGRKGKLVDPEGGLEGRYKFPRGTPRGPHMARAWLEEIEQAVGGVEVAGGVDAQRGICGT